MNPLAAVLLAAVLVLVAFVLTKVLVQVLDMAHLTWDENREAARHAGEGTARFSAGAVHRVQR